MFATVFCVFSLHFNPAINLLGFWYCEKRIDFSFLCIFPLIDDQFYDSIVRVAVEINKRTDK